MWKVLFVAFLALPCRPAAVKNNQDLRNEVDMTPATVDLTPYFKPLLGLGRDLVVASPCIGISGCSWALKAMAVPCKLVHIYDLKLDYLEYIQQHCLDLNMAIDEITLHFGKIKGD